MALEKTAEYLGADTGLQSAVESEYQTIEFTLRGFASEAAILPLTSVVLEDKDISFLAGDDGTVLAKTQVDWYVDSVTVSAAAYKETRTPARLRQTGLRPPFPAGTAKTG